MEAAVGSERADDPGAGGAVPDDVADVVLDDLHGPVLGSRDRAALASGPTSGWPASTPLSTMQTSTAPREPPIAHSRVERPRQGPGAANGGRIARREAPGGIGPRAHDAESAASRALAARCVPPRRRGCAESSSGRVARLTWTRPARRGRRLGERRRRPCVAAHRLASLARGERGEHRHVGRGLGDLERHSAACLSASPSVASRAGAASSAIARA